MTCKALSQDARFIRKRFQERRKFRIKPATKVPQFFATYEYEGPAKCEISFGTLQSYVITFQFSNYRIYELQLGYLSISSTNVNIFTVEFFGAHKIPTSNFSFFPFFPQVQVRIYLITKSFIFITLFEPTSRVCKIFSMLAISDYTYRCYMYNLIYTYVLYCYSCKRPKNTRLIS